MELMMETSSSLSLSEIMTDSIHSTMTMHNNSEIVNNLKKRRRIRRRHCEIMEVADVDESAAITMPSSKRILSSDDNEMIVNNNGNHHCHVKMSNFEMSNSNNNNKQVSSPSTSSSNLSDSSDDSSSSLDSSPTSSLCTVGYANDFDREDINDDDEKKKNNNDSQALADENDFTPNEIEMNAYLQSRIKNWAKSSALSVVSIVNNDNNNNDSSKSASTASFSSNEDVFYNNQSSSNSAVSGGSSPHCDETDDDCLGIMGSGSKSASSNKRQTFNICSQCSSPLVFTSMGDALYCAKPGCSTHRYPICDSTVENLAFGEDSMYFGTPTIKNANHAFKIEASILGRPTTGCATVGIITPSSTSTKSMKSVFESIERRVSMSSNQIGNTKSSTDNDAEINCAGEKTDIKSNTSLLADPAVPAHLSSGLMDYMLMCILKTREYYSDIVKSYCETISSMNYNPDHLMDPFHVMTCVMSLSSKSSSMRAGSFVAPKHCVSVATMICFQQKMLNVRCTNPNMNTTGKHLLSQYQSLIMNNSDFSLQHPTSAMYDSPISIHEVFSFAKSHGYSHIYKDKLTEVYCRLMRRNLPYIDPNAQTNARLFYDQFRRNYQDLKTLDNYSLDVTGGIRENDFENSDHCSYGVGASSKFVWDYKYAWMKTYEFLGLTELRNLVCISSKIQKFINLESSFKRICQSTERTFNPTPFPWQPEVFPQISLLKFKKDDVASLTTTTTCSSKKSKNVCVNDTPAYTLFPFENDKKSVISDISELSGALYPPATPQRVTLLEDEKNNNILPEDSASGAMYVDTGDVIAPATIVKSSLSQTIQLLDLDNNNNNDIVSKSLKTATRRLKKRTATATNIRI